MTQIVNVDKVPDQFVQMIRPEGYTGNDFNAEHVGLNRLRWTDKGNVQQIVGTIVSWKKGDGYTDPEGVVKSTYAMPRNQQGPPFLSGNPFYSPEGSPQGFTQQYFCPTGQMKLRITLDSTMTLDPGTYDIGIHVYLHAETGGDYNNSLTDVFAIGLGYGASGAAEVYRERVNMQPIQDYYLALRFNLTETTTITPFWVLHTLRAPGGYPRNDYTFFLKAYWVAKNEWAVATGPMHDIEGSRQPANNYVAVANLLPQDISAEQAARLAAIAYEKRQTIVYSLGDVELLMWNGGPGSYINLYGRRSAAEEALIESWPYEVRRHPLP